MIWNWEKCKPQIEDGSPPFDVGEAVLSEDTSPEKSVPTYPLEQWNRRNVSLPAGSWARSFLFGTEVPGAHIITLLNEDLEAYL